MEEILEKLCQTAGVLGCLLTGSDGLVIASEKLEGKDTEFLGAMVADLYRNIDTNFQKLEAGGTQLVTIERTVDKLVVHKLQTSETFLAVLTQPRINLGLLRMEVQQAVSKLEKAL